MAAPSWAWLLLILFAASPLSLDTQHSTARNNLIPPATQTSNLSEHRDKTFSCESFMLKCVGTATSRPRAKISLLQIMASVRSPKDMKVVKFTTITRSSCTDTRRNRSFRAGSAANVPVGAPGCAPNGAKLYMKTTQTNLQIVTENMDPRSDVASSLPGPKKGRSAVHQERCRPGQWPIGKYTKRALLGYEITRILSTSCKYKLKILISIAFYTSHNASHFSVDDCLQFKKNKGLDASDYIQCWCPVKLMLLSLFCTHKGDNGPVSRKQTNVGT